MVSPSSIRPFIYSDQDFPISGIPGTNISGIMQNIASSLNTSGTDFIFAECLGAAWFAALTELRSMPGGHPRAGNYSSNAKGIIHFGSAVAGTHPYNLTDSIVYDIKEPDISGIAFIVPPSGVGLSGTPSQIQMDVFTYYARDLRNIHENIFKLIAEDYNSNPSDITMSGIREAYLVSYFPQNSGQYNNPSGPSGFYFIDLAEVQYNPFPRIAGLPQKEYEFENSFYGSRTGHPTWDLTYTGKVFNVGTIPPSDDDYHFPFDCWWYNINLSSAQHGQFDFPYYDYFDLLTFGTSFRSSPVNDPDNDKEFLPFPKELFHMFGVVDSVSPVFPLCQRFNGTLSPQLSNGLFRKPTVQDWWKDGAVLGKESGTYTLDNQASIVYNDWSDPFAKVHSDEMTGSNSLREFCRLHYYAKPQLFDRATWGGTAGNVAAATDAGLLFLRHLRPVLYGYDPGDFLIGYMGWYGSDYNSTVRVDGQGLLPKKTRLRIIEPLNRSTIGWSGCQTFNYYASSEYIVQSGSREIHRNISYRNSNVGVNWKKYPVYEQLLPSPLTQVTTGFIP